MKYRFILLIGFCVMLIVPGCKKKTTEDPGPQNLVIEITNSGDGSGLVQFTAHADNAAHYVFYFGEGLDEPFTSTDGTATHTYVTSGTYKVIVTAFSSSNMTIVKNDDVPVIVDEPAISAAGYTTPDHYDGKDLVWHDEFNGTALATANWNYETGPFNAELQYYKQENTSVHDGYLVITAKVEKKDGKIYTSSRLTTQNKYSFQYGRVDIRALMPKTQALFPALWMLGSSYATVGWPKCGELDIMETICGGGRDSVCYGTAHWDNAGQHASYGGHRGLYNGHLLGDQFHVYSIVWTSTEVKWYLDDVLYHVIDINPAELNELKEESFFIFNVAVGGEWPGDPDGTTVLPQRMVVDYVRVFQ